MKLPLDIWLPKLISLFIVSIGLFNLNVWITLFGIVVFFMSVDIEQIYLKNIILNSVGLAYDEWELNRCIRYEDRR